MSAKKQSRITRRKKRLNKKRILFVLTPVLILFLGVSIWAITLYAKADSAFTNNSHVDDGRKKSELREKEVDPGEDHVSILIIGVDTSDTRGNKDGGLSDTLMLATLNKNDHSVKMLSIPRDSYVYIPEVGYETKINHAHSYGGKDATIDTVERLLDIPVDYWVKVNFDAFIDVVDSLNGINVDVPYELYEQNSEDIPNAIHLLPGEQHLDGEEALALARTRKLDNDIERGKRQQDIIKAILKKTISLSSILKYDDVIDAVSENMTTNLEFDEMKSFISYGTKGSGPDIDTLTLEGDDYWVYEPKTAYYWQIDEASLEETKQLLKEHLDLEDVSEIANGTNEADEIDHAAKYNDNDNDDRNDTH